MTHEQETNNGIKDIISGLPDSRNVLDDVISILLNIDERLSELEGRRPIRRAHRNRKLSSLIEDKMKKTGAVYSSFFLAQELGVGHKAVSQVLSRLSLQKKIDRVASGHYKWAKSGDNQ